MKTILFTDSVDIDAIINSLIEEGTAREEITDDDIYDFWIGETEMNFLMFEKDVRDANKKIGGDIIALANLGLWNGRHFGYKIFRDLNGIFNLTEDYNTFEIDAHNNLRLSATHHDGTNRILFREIKPELTDIQRENFDNKLVYSELTERDITRYTRAIGRYF